MTELFKYCRAENQRKFFETGELRIGTLFGYAEALGPMVGDRMEGRVKVGGTVSDMPGRPGMINPIVQRLVATEGNCDVKITRFQVNDMTVLSDNLYIFSTSNSYSETVHRRWLAEEKYGSCYQIKAAHLFFRAVSASIAKHAAFMGLHRVRYHHDPSGEIDVNSPFAALQPWQLKGGKSYGDQVEVRGIWKPLDSSPISVLKIEVPEAIQYCRLHAELT